MLSINAEFVIVFHANVFFVCVSLCEVIIIDDIDKQQTEYRMK